MSSAVQPRSKSGGGSGEPPRSAYLWVIPWIKDDSTDEQPDFISVHPDGVEARRFQEAHALDGCHTYSYSRSYVVGFLFAPPPEPGARKTDPRLLPNERRPSTLLGVAIIEATLPQLITRLGFSEAKAKGGLVLSGKPEDPTRSLFITLQSILIREKFIPSRGPKVLSLEEIRSQSVRSFG